MVFILREGEFYKTPLSVKGTKPVGFCPCCGEYSLFVISSSEVWCLVCSGLSPSYSLSEEELLAYRAELLASRAQEELLQGDINNA